METKASYVLVGLCTIVGLLLFAAILVFSSKHGGKSDLTRYAVYFKGGIFGLSPGNAVLFNGVRVGTVKEISLDERDQSTVRVIVEVSSKVKMREDCEATLQPLGITGLSSVNISGGSASSPLLQPTDDDDELPVIRSAPSTLQNLAGAAPALIQSAGDLTQRASDMLSQENSENLRVTLDSMAKVSASLAGQTEKIERTLDNLHASSLELAKVLEHADALITDDLNHTVASAGRAFDRLDRMLAEAEPEVQRLTRTGLSEMNRLLADTRTLVQSLDKLIRKVDNNPRDFLLGGSLPEYSPR